MNSVPITDKTHIAQNAERAELLCERSVFVVLPSYNEMVGMPSLLTKLDRVLNPLDFDFKIIVVDDASTDDTAEVCRAHMNQMPIHLVQHGQNKGLSGALETGFRTALEMAMDGDVIVTMDADDCLLYTSDAADE